MPRGKDHINDTDYSVMWRVLVTAVSLCMVTSVAADELATIYGSFRPEVIGRFPEAGDNTRLMDDGYSRVGVKGQTELSNTLQGFYKYERRVSANDGEDDGAVRGDNNELREVHVGLSGPLGSLSMGRHYGLYYDYVDDELDRHRSHYSDAIVFGDLFVSNALSYRSPEFALGNFGVLVEFNDADNQGKSIDERIELAGTLRHGAGTVHAGYVSSPIHEGLYGVAASYDYRQARLVGVYQAIERAGGAEETLASLALDAKIDSDRSVRVALTSKRDQDDSNLDQLFVIVGGDHRFSDHVLVFVEVFRKSTERTQPQDESTLIGGIRFDF